MRSSKPPTLATWLVEHVIPGDKNEALAGDLLEQFSRGRSVAWYWRQVLIALFTGLGKRLHILLVAAGFTMVWGSTIAASRQRLLRSHPFDTVLNWGVTLAWPISAIFEITFFLAVSAVPLLIFLSTYLLVTRRYSFRRLSEGLLAGLVGLVVGTIGGMVLPIHALAGTFKGYVAFSLPVFFALLFSLWAGERPRNAARATTKTPA